MYAEHRARPEIVMEPPLMTMSFELFLLIVLMVVFVIKGLLLLVQVRNYFWVRNFWRQKHELRARIDTELKEMQNDALGHAAWESFSGVDQTPMASKIWRSLPARERKRWVMAALSVVETSDWHRDTWKKDGVAQLGWKNHAKDKHEN